MTYDPKAHGAQCAVCPRRGQTVVPPEGRRDKARAVWLGQDPGKMEEKEGRPFVGPTGVRLRHLWETACHEHGVSLPRNQLWVTNAALCAPITKGEREAKAAVDCCRPRLLAELLALRRAQPHAQLGILPMGKNAWLALTGQAKGQGGLQGFHVPVSLLRMSRLIHTTKLPTRKEADDAADIPF